MVTTSRKLELIIRSRALASPFLIFAASSISCCGVKRGNRPISRKYLLNPVSVSFMSRTYSPEPIRRYCAREGFFRATREAIPVPSFEIESALTNQDHGSAESGTEREGDVRFQLCLNR